MADPYVTIPAPTRRPRRGGWASVAHIVDVPRLAAATGIEWEALQCGAIMPTPTDCFGAITRADDPGYPGKLDDPYGLGWAQGEGKSLAGYYAVACTVGSDADFDAIARAGLEESEGSYIEVAMAQILFPDTAIALPDQPNPVYGIAALDQFADQRYAGGGPTVSGYEGEPIIWINRGDAVILKADDAIDGNRDGELWTANGTPVVASAELPSGTAYVSGQLIIARSQIVSTRVIDHMTNTEYAVAERVYAAGFDCLIPVQVSWTEDGGGAATFGYGNFGNAGYGGVEVEEETP